MKPTEDPFTDGVDQNVLSETGRRSWLRRRFRWVAVGCLALLLVAVMVVRSLTVEPVDGVSISFETLELVSAPPGLPGLEKLVVAAKNDGDKGVPFQLTAVETKSGGIWVRDARADLQGINWWGRRVSANTTSRFELHLPKSANRTRLTFIARVDYPADGVFNTTFRIVGILLGQNRAQRLALGIRDLIDSPAELIVEIENAPTAP